MRETSERQNRSLNIIILIHRIRLISGPQPAFLIEHVDDDIELMEWRRKNRISFRQANKSRDERINLCGVGDWLDPYF